MGRKSPCGKSPGEGCAIRALNEFFNGFPERKLFQGPKSKPTLEKTRKEVSEKRRVRRVSLVALPKLCDQGGTEECQSAREREGPQHENGASEELQMVREWSGEGSAESSGHQTERSREL